MLIMLKSLLEFKWLKEINKRCKIVSVIKSVVCKTGKRQGEENANFFLVCEEKCCLAETSFSVLALQYLYVTYSVYTHRLWSLIIKSETIAQ